MDKRPKKIIPLYEFDEHNEAFYFWHKAKYGNYLDGPLDLFHIDAHSDIGLPKLFKKSVYFTDQSQNHYLQYYKDFARSELNIGNFILPAVLSGLIKNIYFIYPKWRKFKPTRRRINISSAFGQGKVLKCEIDLKKSPNPKAVFKALPDLKCFNYYAYGIERIPKNRRIILDIDLDYFACRDSASNDKSYELEITKGQFLDRESFLNNKSIPFSGLDFSFEERNKKYFVKISSKKVEDAAYLPSEAEVDSEINALVSTLEAKRTIPAIITMCRSCVSGHCPADYCEFIERTLKQRLLDSFDVIADVDRDVSAW